jgi:hypothetical protein
VNAQDSVLRAAAILAQLALNIALPLAIVRRDLRRLPPERLQRAWPDSTLLGSVVAFGPLCLPVHFARTRSPMRGLLIGLFWAACVFLVTTSLVPR